MDRRQGGAHGDPHHARPKKGLKAHFLPLSPLLCSTGDKRLSSRSPSITHHAGCFQAFLSRFLPLPRFALPLLSAGNPHVKGSGSAHAPATPTPRGNCFPCHQAGETFGFPFKRCFLHFSSFPTRCKLLHCFTHAFVSLNSVLCHPNKARHARK